MKKESKKTVKFVKVAITEKGSEKESGAKSVNGKKMNC
jgi:hypothetical protein